MKTPKTNADVVDSQQQSCNLLQEAMKQPGVKTVMDVFESMEEYTRPVDDYANYVDWQRFPASFGSCETAEPA
jgi:hypothetical protein